MAGNCLKEDCYPDDTGCNHEGCTVLTECKYYNTRKDEPVKTDESPDDFFVRIPWTGNAMGLQDLNFLSSTSPIVLIGVTGVASAGKTTFLATLYCLLRHGYPIGDYQFAGSKTLIGWESIAWFLSWSQHNDIQFPPHTSSNAGRVPGLLHLSLKDSKGEKRELVFTDAPGEWFAAWITNRQGEKSRGAEWIHSHADAFLLFADCEELSGSGLGKARQQIKQVGDRIKHNLDKRPLGLIWSKSDIPTERSIKEQISAHLQNSPIANYKDFEVSARNEEQNKFQLQILESIKWILHALNVQVNSVPETERFAPSDLFLSKR